MTQYRRRAWLLGFLFLWSSCFFADAQSTLSLKEIVERNIQAAGGKEKISQIQNFSFKAGEMTYYVASDGRMKMTIGKEPVITEVFVVGQDKIQRNCFNKITEITGLEKARTQCLAELYSGLFTLQKFEEKLSFLGLKSFGPEKLYLLTTTCGDLKVDFYLKQDEFTIKRIVFQGHSPEGDKYEVNYDYGPIEEIDGLRLPGSWFASQVGTRGNLYELSDLKMNPPLEKDFLSRVEVNVGKVEIAAGSLKGNVIEFSSRGKDLLMISTNWTKDCIERLGIKTNDRLSFLIGSKEIELVFYDTAPPREALVPGAKVMFPAPQGENYLIYLLSPEFIPLIEQLKPLLPIQIKKK